MNTNPKSDSNELIVDLKSKVTCEIKKAEAKTFVSSQRET